MITDYMPIRKQKVGSDEKKPGKFGMVCCDPGSMAERP